MSRFTFEDLGKKFIGDENFFETYNKFFIYGDEKIVSKCLLFTEETSISMEVSS